MKPTKITNAKILKQGFLESDQHLYQIRVDVEFDLGFPQKTTIVFLKKEKKWHIVRASSQYVGGVRNNFFKEQFEIIKKDLMDHPSIKLKLLFAKQEIGVLV